MTEIKRLLTEEPAVFQQSDILTLSGNLATKSMIDDALKGFFNDSSSEDVLFLYWSGHGEFDQNNAYFIPYDADEATISSTSINMSDVKKYIDETPGQTVLSFFDTCHSGALLRGTTIDALINRGLDIKGSGKVVVAACTEDQSASDRGKHGAFTNHLIHGLKGGAMNLRGEVDKSILSEVNEVSLVIENNTIERITINGNRPRIYSNVVPSNITIDHSVRFPMPMADT